MAVAMNCPNCQAQFRLADEMAGKKMKCQKCAQLFVVPKAEPVLDMELDDQPAPAETAISTKPAAPPPPRDPDDEAAAEDRIKKGPSKPPPLKKKNDAAARPTVKARRKQPAASGSGLMTIVVLLLLGGGLFACVGVVGLAGYFMFAASDQPKPPPPPAPIAIADNKVEPPPPPPAPPPPPKEQPRPKEPPPPKEPVGINVAFGGDGTFRASSLLTAADPISPFGGRHKLYLAQFEAGKTYHIELAVRDVKGKDFGFDPYLYLLDDQKKVLAEDNDSGGEPNARIVYRAERTGSFRILATHFGPLKTVGPYNLSIRLVDSAGKSFVVNTHKLDGFDAKELALASNIGSIPLVGSEPCWDGQGKSFYCLVPNSATLQRISREGKLEAVTTLPIPCHHLALSAEGLVTFPLTGNEIWLIDAQTLAIRAKIPHAAAKKSWLGAAPGSALAVVLGTELASLNLQEQKVFPFRITGGPGALPNPRSVALSPDGKFLCVQAFDYVCHGFRMDGIQLKHETSRPAAAKAAVYFQFSPDSKQVVMTYPGPAGFKKTVGADVFAIDAWDKPAYTVPAQLKLAAIDGRGGLYGLMDKELRYYADPSAPNASFQTLLLPTTGQVRRLLAPPQGPGCLILAQQQSFLLEPKN